MKSTDLTTLTNAKAWLGINASTDDVLLARLITAVSGFVQRWLNRNIASQSYTEHRDGMGYGEGRRVMVLANYPVTAISSLTVDGIAIPASPDNGDLQAGYGFDDGSIWLSASSAYASSFWPNGYQFARGRRNVVVSYTAGYLISGEAATVPSSSAYTVTTARPWNGDRGVTYANGTALTAVASNPSQGQYSVSEGAYSFNAADAGAAVLITYSYTPEEIEQAVIELLSLRYRERSRIGQKSQTLGAGETVAYITADMPDSVKALLQQYRKVVPL
jgi:hypothetical protein